MDDGQAYLDLMVQQRGYVLDFHKTMAAEDLDFLRAYNQLLEQVYLDKHVLDEKTKELLYVAVLTAIGGFASHIKSHMEEAVRSGATKEEVLATLQLMLPAAGVARFMLGFQVWQDVFKPRKLEPSAGG